MTTRPALQEPRPRARLVEEALTLTLDVLSKNLRTIVVEKERYQVLADLVKTVEGHRLYMLSSVEMARDLWDRIGQSTSGAELIALIIRSTAELKLRLSGGQEGFNTLSRAIGDAYSHSSGRAYNQGKNCVIDSDLLELLPKEQTLSELLQDNHWLVFLYLLSNHDLITALREMTGTTVGADEGKTN